MCCLNEGAFINHLQEQPLHLPIIEVASRTEGEQIDILNHASRLLKAELPLSLRLIGVRMPHFSKDKSGVQFDPRQRTLLNFIKVEDNNKQIFNKNGEQEQLTKKNLIPFGFFMSKYSF
ncbi:hypothetical protein Tco_0268635 [Tanacetum coccineum]